MNQSETENWVTMKEAQTHLGVRRETISKWIKTRGLPAYKVGRVWKFKLSEIDEWVRNSTSAIDESKAVDGQTTNETEES